MGNYRITGYRPGDEEHILRLFRHAYGRGFRMDAWRWQFLNTPYEIGRMVNVWDGDRLVAHTAITVFQACLDGREKLAAYSGHTMADREYLGISKLLLSRMRDSADDLDILYAFPNQNSYRIFKDILRFVYLGDIYFWFSQPETGAELPPGITEISCFEPAHGMLYRTLISSHRFITKRDLVRLNWRVMQKPDSGYRLFECRDEGVLKGYMVLNLYLDAGILQGQIIDIVAPDKRVMDRMLHYAQVYFGRLGCAAVKLWLPSEHFRGVLDERGFRPGGRPFPMIIGARCCDIRDFYLTMIDSDVF